METKAARAGASTSFGTYSVKRERIESYLAHSTKHRVLAAPRNIFNIFMTTTPLKVFFFD